MESQSDVIFALVKTKHKTTATELSKDSKLSKAEVNKILYKLQKEKLIGRSVTNPPIWYVSDVEKVKLIESINTKLECMSKSELEKMLEDLTSKV